MQKISPIEASVLSYLARHTDIPSEQRKRVSAPLKGISRKIADALKPKRNHKIAKASTASRTARGLRSWAVQNDELATVAAKKKR